MIITFQIQLDSEPKRDYTSEQLNDMYRKMLDFCISLENYGFVRREMYKDQKVWWPTGESH